MAKDLLDEILDGTPIDGDTVRTRAGQGVRITGADAPEKPKQVSPSYYQPGEAGHDVATQWLEENLPTAEGVTDRGTDHYGRQLAEVERGGENLMNQAIRAGVATPMFRQGTPEQTRALGTNFMNRATGNRTEWDDRMDAARAEKPPTINFAPSADRQFRPRDKTEKAWDRGTDNMQAAGYAAANAAGEFFGSEELADWGREGMEQNLTDAALSPADVGTMDDIEDVSDVGSYLYEAVVEQAPNLLTMVGTGGVGGLTARGVAGLAGRKALGQAAKRGAMAGAAGANYPMQVGETQINFIEGGVDAPGTALFVTGPLNTALDMASLNVMFGQAFKGISDPKLAKDLVAQMALAAEAKGVTGGAIELAKALGKEGAKGVTISGSTEGLTEGLQTLTNLTARAYHDPSFDPLGEEGLTELREAVVKGAATGGAFGGAGRLGGTASGVTYEHLQNRDGTDTDVGTIEPETGEGGAVAQPETLTDVLSTEPEVQPEAQPEVQPEAQPEVQPEAQPEAQPEPEVQPQPEARPQGNPDLRPHEPEPVADLQAQMKAVVNQTKSAMIVTPEQATPELMSEANNLGLGFKDTAKGLVIYNRKQAGNKARALARAIAAGDNERANRIAGELGMGLPADVAQVDPAEATEVVTARDADGNVVSEAYTATPEQTERTAEALAGQAGPETTVETRSPEAVIDERRARRGQEATEGGPAGGAPREQGVAEAPAQYGTEPATLGQVLQEPPATPPLSSEQPELGAFEPKGTDEDRFNYRGREQDHIEQGLDLLRQVAGSWLKPLGMEVPTLAVLDTTSETNLGNYDSDTATLRINRNELLGLGGDKDRRGQAKLLEVLAHEIGHHVDYQYIQKLPVKDRRVLEDAYNRWRESALRLNDGEARRSRATGLVQGDISKAMAEGRGKKRPSHYTLGRNEWFADQIARDLLNESLAEDSPAFKRIVRNATRLMRRLYRQIAKTLGWPASDPAIAEFMRDVRDRVAEDQGWVEPEQYRVGEDELAEGQLGTTGDQELEVTVHPTTELADSKFEVVLKDVAAMLANNTEGDPIERAGRTFILPPEVGREQGFGEAALQALIKAREDGEHSSKNRITLPFLKNTAGQKKLRLNSVALTRLGFLLNGQDSTNARPADARDAFTSALVWLGEHGADISEADLNAGLLLLPRKGGGVRWGRAEKATRLPKPDSGGRPGRTSYVEHGPFEDSEPFVAESETTDGLGLETEAQANRRSVREARGGKRGDPAQTGKAQTRALPGSDPRLTEEAETLRELLDAVDAPVRADLADEKALPGMIEALNKQNTDEARHNAALLAKALNSKASVTTFLQAGEGYVRPLIVVPSTLKGAERGRQLVHEAGHVVLRATWQNAPDRVRSELRKALGAEEGTALDVAFEEKFADAFAQWTEQRSKRSTGLLGSFFQDLRRKLRQLWSRARKSYDINESFNQFMDALLAHSLERNGWGEAKAGISTPLGKAMREWLDDRTYSRMTAQGETDLLNYTVPTPVSSAVKRALNTRAAKTTALTGRGVGQVLTSVWDAYGKPFDGYLRKYGMDWLADHFRLRTRGGSTNQRATVFQQIRGEYASFSEKMNAIIEKGGIPRVNLWQVVSGKQPERPAAVQQAQEELMAGEPTSPLAREVADYFESLYKWLGTKGVHFAKRKNYVPFMISKSKISRAGLAKFTEDVVAWGQSPAGEAYFRSRAEAEGQPYRAPSKRALEEFAAGLYSKFLTNEGGIMEQSLSSQQLREAFPEMAERNMEFLDGDNPALHPGFGFMRRREMPDSLIQQLRKYREDDIPTLMVTYTHSAVKRGVWQERFGEHELNEAIRKEWGKVWAAKRAYEADATPSNLKAMMEAREAAKQFSDRTRADYLGKYGVELNDPVAGLKRRLHEQRVAGKLDEKAYEYAIDKIIPGYLGRLGADMDPGLRRFMGWSMFYLNTVMLSLSALSQLVDFGILVNNAKGARMEAIKNIARLMKKGDRQQMLKDAEALGVISQETTDYILNDATDVFAADFRLNRLNEGFFKLNQMHRITEWGRAAAMITGKHMLVRMADGGSEQTLQDMGTSAEAIRAWIEAGTPMRYSPEHESVFRALHMFADSSVLRPDPTIKPFLGNDQRFALFWHLKSFMYAFHENVLKTAIVDAQRKWGEEQGAKKVMAALPFLMLAGTTFPLAMAGMELRWQIAPPKQPPEFGSTDYNLEVVTRSGVLGMLQPLYDAQTAENRGKMALFSIAGPFASKFEEFLTKDWEYFWPKMLPAYPITQQLQPN